MKKDMKFFDKYACGLICESSFDEHVGKWHDNDYGCDLFEFLGMTRKEYSDYVWGDKTLYELVKERK